MLVGLCFVATALRALVVTPETNSLPLVEALSQEDLPQGLVLPVANLLVAKKASRLEMLAAPLVERMTPLERNCFALSTSNSATGCHIFPPIVEEHKPNGIPCLVLCILAGLGGAAILIFKNRGAGSRAEGRAEYGYGEEIATEETEEWKK